jgi:hypothetical protein
MNLLTSSGPVQWAEIGETITSFCYCSTHGGVQLVGDQYLNMFLSAGNFEPISTCVWISNYFYTRQQLADCSVTNVTEDDVQKFSDVV